MKNKLNKILNARILIIVFLILYVFLCNNFFEFRWSDEEVRAYFEEKNLEVSIHYYDTLGREMRYISIGADTLPTILFVHGSPSSLRAWKHFMSDSLLVNNYRMVMVDRPGYGFSGFGKAEPSITRQANLLTPALKRNGKPMVVVGASYGGPVAASLAMNNPDKVSGLFLLSASIAPKEEKTYWITYPTSNWFLKYFIPVPFRVANEEKLSHRAHLEELLPLWKNLSTPVKVVHGDVDDLIYPANADFAKKMITNSEVDVVMLPGMGHGLQFSHPDVVKKQLYNFLENLSR